MANTNVFLSDAKIEKIIATKCSSNDKCLYKVALNIDNNRRLTTIMFLFATVLFLCEAIIIVAAINVLFNLDRYLTEITVTEFIFRILFLSTLFFPLGIHLIRRANKIKASGKIPQYYLITSTRFLKISVGFFCGANTFVSMDWGGFEKASCHGLNSIILYPESDELTTLRIDTNSIEEATEVAELVNSLIKDFPSHVEWRKEWYR